MYIEKHRNCFKKVLNKNFRKHSTLVRWLRSSQDQATSFTILIPNSLTIWKRTLFRVIWPIFLFLVSSNKYVRKWERMLLPVSKNKLDGMECNLTNMSGLTAEYLDTSCTLVVTQILLKVAVDSGYQSPYAYNVRV